MKMYLLLTSLFLIIYFKKSMSFFSPSFMAMLTISFYMNFNFKYFYWSQIYLSMGMDNVSFSLMMMTLWIMSISILADIKYIKNFKFYMNMMIMTMLFIMCFSTMDLLYFYIFFESSLIPMMLLILGWGSQIDRIQASMYLIFYTLFGSLPLLMILIHLNMKFFSNSMSFMLINNNNNIYSLLMYMFMMSAFFIKLPMYYVHIWLPKAHVQAPVSGSMILAGIMLKLGSYGIYRLIIIYSLMNMKFNYMIISISLIGSIYASLICLNQIDLKIIVAYSSIVHMNMMLASILILNKWSMNGSLWLMIAHGLTSSGMFCIVNFNYERLKSRNLFINKGLINIYPSMTLWWFLISSSNFAAPLSLNLFSEMFMINSLMMYSFFNLIFIFLITFMSTSYSIFLFSFTQHGINIKLNNNINMTINEFLMMMTHWIPLNLIFLKINII